MTEEPTRKLAVLLHADVIGSTSLVQQNETVAHQRIQDAFRRFSVTIANHGGIAHEIRGDAIVVEFSRASDAITAALEFQASNSACNKTLPDKIRPELRVGIAMGEVVIADNTVTGEGIVLAQRLEQLAEPGSVCIQGAVYETIPKRLPFDYEDLGERELKGFNTPVRVYTVKQPFQPNTPISLETGTTDKIDKPSIAVLPFTNMSGDPEQEYFSDGISEDIITELSRFRTLFVIARNSSFAFKGGGVDIKQIGRKLGVQYVVEGSVRRAGNRVRITAQLIEAETGNHIWAERYDRDLEDIFAVQDEVTRSIVAVLPGRVQNSVAEQASRKPTDNLKAYEHMLRGKALRDGLNAIDTAKARQHYEKALAIDPDYARAYMYLADTYVVDGWLGLANTNAPDMALRLARKGASLDNNDVYIQDQLGYAFLCAGLWEDAEVQFDKTISKIVNEAESMGWCGYGFMLLGRHDKAQQTVLEAMRLDPFHPPALDWILGQIYYFAEQFEDVIRVLMGEALLNSLAHAFLVGAFAQLERFDEAETALASFIKVRHQEFQSRNLVVEKDTIEALAGSYRNMWRLEADWRHIADGLRKAGLPD